MGNRKSVKNILDVFGDRSMIYIDSYKNNPLSVGLVSYWKLDETNGNAIDSHGTNDGTVNGATQGVTGKIGNAYSFDGIDDYVNIGNDNSLEFTDSNAFTLSAWVNLGQIDSSNREIIRRWEAGQTQYILRKTSANVFEIIWNDGSTKRITSTFTLSAGQWYHVVGTFEIGNQNLYLNGVSNGSRSLTGSLASSTGNTYIGYTSAGFKGTIDEVGIWNRALTSDNILELYNSGDGLTYPFAA